MIFLVFSVCAIVFHSFFCEVSVTFCDFNYFCKFGSLFGTFSHHFHVTLLGIFLRLHFSFCAIAPYPHCNCTFTLFWYLFLLQLHLIAPLLLSAVEILFGAIALLLFLWPALDEATAGMELLRCFGEASCLRCNLAKSKLSSTHCAGLDLAPVIAELGCPWQEFPIK